MPFQLTEVVLDPDMGQPIVINRSQGSFGPGGWQTTGTSQIPTFGVIEIDQDQLDKMIPEGDRISGAIGVYIPIAIYPTHLSGAPPPSFNFIGPGVSDEIVWNGEPYSVTSVGPWNDFGYYFAVLLRLPGF